MLLPQVMVLLIRVSASYRDSHQHSLFGDCADLKRYEVVNENSIRCIH